MTDQAFPTPTGRTFMPEQAGSPLLPPGGSPKLLGVGRRTQVLHEQIASYRARAGEYDDW
jgi:hypothetical protein